MPDCRFNRSGEFNRWTIFEKTDRFGLPRQKVCRFWLIYLTNDSFCDIVNIVCKLSVESERDL